ncbi:MAG TPA: STAS domain-containing protein [Terriglobales bacterium]|nr:STAS domain-containing protein [Terriglobales bacterium]
MWIKIDEKISPTVLREAEEKLLAGDSEVTLDFSSVSRVDAPTLRELAELARIADAKAGRVNLRGVNVDVYKVLKLVKLTQKFSFAN